MRFVGWIVVSMLAGCGSSSAPSPQAEPMSVALPEPTQEPAEEAPESSVTLRPVEEEPSLGPEHPESGPDVDAFLAANKLAVRGHLAAAKQAYAALIRKHPDSTFVPDAFLALGDLFAREGKLDKASKSYTKALEFPHASAAPRARYERAWTFFNMGEKKRALGELVQLLGAKPGAAVRSDAEEALPVIFADVGAPNKAWPFFAKVAKKRAPELMLRLHDIYAQRGKPADAATVRAEYERQLNLATYPGQNAP